MAKTVNLETFTSYGRQETIKSYVKCDVTQPVIAYIIENTRMRTRDVSIISLLIVEQLSREDVVEQILGFVNVYGH